LRHCRIRRNRGRHLITVKTEHKAVLDTMRELERQGSSATYLAPMENGLLDLDELKAAMRPGTVLASVMFVNNEISVIQDIAAIGKAKPSSSTTVRTAAGWTC